MHAIGWEAAQGYRSWSGDAAEDHIGPFFYRLTENGAETLFRVQAHNLNSSGSVHGGVLMTFIDYTLCVAAVGETGERVVTVSCNSEFIAGAREGAVLEGRGEVVRRTGSMVFTRGSIEADGATILTASAVVKRIRR
jgi:uncharacterized protein (TIGR00369 family)